MNPKKISYIYAPYAHHTTRGQNGVITLVSTTYPSEYNYHSCVYGASYCVPGDNFCKKTGVEIATARMFAHSADNTLIVPDDRYDYFSIQLMILAHLFNSNELPNWAQRYIMKRMIGVMERTVYDGEETFRL